MTTPFLNVNQQVSTNQRFNLFDFAPKTSYNTPQSIKTAQAIQTTPQVSFNVPKSIQTAKTITPQVPTSGVARVGTQVQAETGIDEEKVQRFIQRGKDLGKSKEQLRIAYEKAKNDGLFNKEVQQEQGFISGALQKTGESFVGGIKRIGEAGVGIAEGKYTPMEGAMRGGAGALQSAFSPISGVLGQTLQTGIEQIPEDIRTKIKTEATPTIEGVANWYNSQSPEQKRRLDNAGVGLEILGSFLGVKGVQKVTPAIKQVGQQTFKQGEKVLKQTSTLGKKLIPNTENIADRLSTNVNRMTKGEINKFKDEIGVSPGKFLNDRGITDSGDTLVEKLSNNLKQSRQEADKGMESIQGTFKAPKEKIATDVINKKTGKYIVKEQDPIETMLSDNLTNASSKGMAQDSLRAKELLEKYQEGGLSMSEINESKRFFNANNKFGYFTDDTTARKGFVTNLDNTIRKWQYDTAEQMGFTNLKEINKQTKAYYKLLEGITKWNEGTQGNLPMGLTDWLAFNADPGIFLAKQVAQSGILKKGALKLLNVGRKTQQEVKPALISNKPKNVNNIRNSSNSTTLEDSKLKNVVKPVVTPKQTPKPLIKEGKLVKKDIQTNLSKLDNSNIDEISLKITSNPKLLPRVKEVIKQHLTKYGNEFKEYMYELVDKIADTIGTKMNLLGKEGIGVEKTKLLNKKVVSPSDDLIENIGKYTDGFKEGKLFDISPQSKSQISSMEIKADMGEITPKEIDNLNKWFKDNKDNYIKLYHGTSSQHKILDEGLKSTSKKTARSLQSGGGYVYLSFDPSRAKTFGEMAYAGKIPKVYEVKVRIGDLLSDTDQLGNKRYWGENQNIGNTLADSLLYGKGFKVKGNIEPYKIKIYK